MILAGKTVFVSGNFNVLHPGHLRLLRFAKESGDRLIVGVTSNRFAGHGAYVPEQLRLEGIQSSNWVDEAFLLDQPVTDAINRIRPDIVVKGKEYEFGFNPELAVLEQYGGRLLFGSGETTFSSVDLIRKEFELSDSRSIALPMDFMERHAIDRKRLEFLLLEFSKLKVCVVGDLIVDEYITCQALGMSQEDTTIVVTPIDTARFIGGAGIVAAHAVGLGASVEFVSISGNDAAREFAQAALVETGVKAQLLLDESRPTTVKQRFRSQGKTLLRVSHLHQAAISVSQQKKMLEALEQALEHADLLVFSDFNYGCLPQVLVDKIVKIAKARHIMQAADSQSSSQVGDISRFKGMDLITPTEREARISTRNQEDGLVVLGELLRKQSVAGNILLKLGAEGLLIHSCLEGAQTSPTDRIGALNPTPKDVAGAGDSLLITSSMTLASGGSIWESALLGSMAAAVQVGRVGNTPIRIKELLSEFSIES